MLRKIAALCCAMLMLFSVTTAHGQVERHALLDEGFRLLEKGNIFIDRYNRETGAAVEPLFELGIPYFFGGGIQIEDIMLASYPEYRQMKAWVTDGGYSVDKTYLVGLDCSGFTNYLYEKAGLGELGNLRDVFSNPAHREHFLYTHKEGQNLPADWEEAARCLKVGDVVVAFHPARHLMMYIGTLTDYGFTAEELPLLADYLHYPLVIHCGSNPLVKERFANLIRTTERYKGCTPPDGGTQVSILGVPTSLGEEMGLANGGMQYGFWLDENTSMTIFNWDTVGVYVWYRKNLE